MIDRILSIILVVIQIMIIMGSLFAGIYIIQNIEYREGTSMFIATLANISIFVFFYQLGIVIAKTYPKL